MNFLKMNSPKFFSKIIVAIITFVAITFFSCNNKKEIIEESKYNAQQVNKHFKLADKYYDDNKYDSAFYYANKIRLEINPKKNLKKYTTTMFIIITSQQMSGDYSGAESSIVETLSAIEKLNKDIYNFKFYSMLGLNYSYLHQYKDAIYYFKKTLNYNITSTRKIASYINIGYIYIKQKKYNKAIQIYNQILRLKELKKNKYYYSGVLNNLGYCLHKVKNPNAITYLNQAFELTKKMDATADDDYSLTGNYYYLYEYYLNINKTKALNYAKLLYGKANEYKNPDDQLLALSLLVKNTEGNESKRYALKYVNLNDSITNIRQKAKNYFAKLKYDSKKEKEENQKLKAEKELQQELERNKNIVIIFIIVIILIVSGFIYFYLIEKNKKEKIQTAYQTETRIAKKLHDELANNLYQTIAFAEIQDLSSANNKEKLLDSLDNIYANTRNISRENSPVETGNQFSSNLKEMIIDFKTNSINLIINGFDDINWTTIEDFKKITIYRILQELLVNMKKHSQCNLVIIAFKKQDNNLLLNYYDNGIGINFDEKIKKNGLRNIESRIIAVNGTIAFESKPNNGIKVNMSIPI